MGIGECPVCPRITNLNGDLFDTYYPLGPTYEFTTSESGAARVISAGDTVYNVFESGTYTPDGQLATVSIGGWQGTTGAVAVSNTYNSRLQPIVMSAVTGLGAPVLNLTYNFNLGNGTSGTDNGNVISVTNANDRIGQVNYTYDSLNRINSAYTSGTSWGENYTIDAWGNLTNISGYAGKTNSETLTCAPASGQNQLNTCFTYDAAGNLIQNGSATYFYDAENRLLSAGGFTYIYDGDGDLVPAFRTKLSMISAKERGKRNVEEQSHRSADDRGTETTGSGA